VSPAPSSYGVYLEYSDNSLLSGNLLSAYYGIVADSSDNNTIDNNIVRNGYIGIGIASEH